MLKSYRDLFESLDLTPLDFCLWGLIKGDVCKTNVDTWDEFLDRILDSAARTKKCEDQIRRKTRDLHTRGAKRIELDGGIFERLLWAVTNLSFNH